MDDPIIEIHNSDLPILCLPAEEESKMLLNGPCSSKAAAAIAQTSASTSIVPHYRFFDLPLRSNESDIVLYPELHAVFSVNVLQAKIKTIRGAKTKDSDSHGPKIVELNDINLNQPTDPTKRGKFINKVVINFKHPQEFVLQTFIL
jgi:hypothetical protein